MSKGQTLKTFGAALAVSAALAACGGGSGSGAKAPSALDPANMVPASALAYADITIRPQGNIRAELVEAIDSIAGQGAARKLSASWARSDHGFKAIEPYLGQHMGIALTALPASMARSHSVEDDLLAVLPSNNPAAAQKAERRSGRSSWRVSKIVGHYLLVGGASAVEQAAGTTAKTSLAAATGFKSDMSQLGSGEVVSVYVSLHQLYAGLLPLLRSDAQTAPSALAQEAKEAPPGSSAAIGLSARHNEFRLDMIQNGTHLPSNPPVTSVASDVSALPASSWLAATFGGALSKASTVDAMTAGLSRSLTAIRALNGRIGGRIPDGPLSFLAKDLLPALGPAELSASGSSPTTLQAGLVMAPANRRAGARLAAALKQLVKHLPVSATTSGGRVAVTFGFSDLAQLLNPSSKLADNAAFKQALGQLPSGAKASLYLNFAGISALASLDQSAGHASTMRVLHRLDYLIAGGTRTHFRLVLATH